MGMIKQGSVRFGGVEENGYVSSPEENGCVSSPEALDFRTWRIGIDWVVAVPAVRRNPWRPCGRDVAKRLLLPLLSLLYSLVFFYWTE